MSVLDNQSRINASASLFAPAGTSGGGGGGGVNLTVSTITFGVGQPANILTQTNILDIAGVGDTNSLQLGSEGQDQFLGNQYCLQFSGSNGSGGDVTFCDINGNNSALLALNGQSRGLNSQNVSTIIYGATILTACDDGAGASLHGRDFTCSTLFAQNLVTMAGGANMSNTTLQFSQFSQNAAVAYYNASNTNLYITCPSTAVVAIGTQSNAANLQVGDTSINIPTALYATNQGVIFSTLTVSTIITPSLVPGSNVVTAWLQSPGNQIQIQQSNSAGASAVFGWPNATQVNLGMIAANATDGMSFICDNGFAYISGGGGHFSLSNVSSINGNAPALTSYSQQDVGALFSTLFAANPGLSTIVY